MKYLPLIFAVATVVSAVEKAVTIGEVTIKSKREGLYLLDQGYSGSFSFTNDSYLIHPWDIKEFEFTHARFNDEGAGNRSPRAHVVVVGMDRDDGEVSYSRETVYLQKIPSLESLKGFRTIAEFEKVFGPFRGDSSRWSLNEEMHSSIFWRVFTRETNGSIRAVMVYLWTVDRGKGWEIKHRKIGEGLFKPTGQRPRLEKEERKQSNKPDMATPNKPPE